MSAPTYPILFIFSGSHLNFDLIYAPVALMITVFMETCGLYFFTFIYRIEVCSETDKEYNYKY